MKPGIDLYYPNYFDIDAFISLSLFSFLFFFGVSVTHAGPMNTMQNLLVHREDLKLLLQQGFPSHSPPPTHH